MPALRRASNHSPSARVVLKFLFLLLGTIPLAIASPLPTVQLQVNDQTLTAEIARTPEQMSRGLMFRTELEENHGMLFIFPHDHRASFWMKNTLIPLSIAYLDNAGVILEIHPLEPLNETPVRSETERVRYALEVNQGWFEKHAIQPGDKVSGIPSTP